MSNMIIARFTAAGIHRWPDAPDRRRYLRSPHRHLFHVKVYQRVVHSGRDVEFHDLAESAHVAFIGLGTQYHEQSTLRDFGARSCEMLAEALAQELRLVGFSPHAIVVSEDGENDGIWEAV